MKNNFGNKSCKEIVENICPYCNEHLLNTVEGWITPVSVNKYAFGETNYGWTWNKLKSSVSVNKEVNL